MTFEQPVILNEANGVENPKMQPATVHRLVMRVLARDSNISMLIHLARCSHNRFFIKRAI
jgi:hypothetical protein